ncbi:MAG: hypothetical protein QM287_06020, partial [Bacillota bacterium]|nr:hypothetical protein [Bacillota bacterium]
MMRNRMEVTIEQRQKLTLTPELKQSIEILRYSLDDLAAFVREQALENPMMELEERAFSDSMEAAAETERTREALLELVDRFPNSGSYQTQADQAKESDAVSFLDFHAKSTTLKDDLLFQLHTLNPDPAVLHSARILIDHLNDNGYLKTPLDHIVQTHAVAEEAVREALTLVQTLEPKGVCARNLAECLLLQLSPEDTLPRLLIAEHLEDIAANRLRFIAKERQVSMEKLLEAIDTIKSL